MSEAEKAKKSIIEHLNDMENDNVLRSMCFVMGDYTVKHNGEERADYIAAILQNIIGCIEIEKLSHIYFFTKALSKKTGGKK